MLNALFESNFKNNCFNVLLEKGLMHHRKDYQKTRLSKVVFDSVCNLRMRVTLKENYYFFFIQIVKAQTFDAYTYMFTFVSTFLRRLSDEIASLT